MMHDAMLNLKVAQHGTAWHSMAQHGTAWHSTDVRPDTCLYSTNHLKIWPRAHTSLGAMLCDA